MPFTRITVREGMSEAALQQISDILHRALTQEFSVPETDRFQVIEVLAAQRRIYDAHYLSGTRNDDFILFHIVAGKPRTREQKQRFYALLSEQLKVRLKIHPDNVMVIIQFNRAEEWSFSGGKMYCSEAL